MATRNQFIAPNGLADDASSVRFIQVSWGFSRSSLPQRRGWSWALGSSFTKLKTSSAGPSMPRSW
jgi:hypothetical protein